MTSARPAVVSATLAAATLGLTLDELSRPQPTYFSWPNGPEVGAVALLALVAALGWLVHATRSRPSAHSWAKAAFALAVSIPLAWIAATEIVRRKLLGLPDGALPEGLAERMTADVLQMQIAALLVTTGVLVCVAMTAQRMRRLIC